MASGEAEASAGSGRGSRLSQGADPALAALRPCLWSRARDEEGEKSRHC